MMEEFATWSQVKVEDPADAAAVAQVEDDLGIDRLGLETATRLAETIFELAPKPVVVRVESPSQCVFHGAQDGTNRFNGVAVERKIATVMALGHSTLWWNKLLAARGSTQADHPLVDDDLYTDIPGGFPLRVAGQLVGAAAVSGMAPLEDHALVIAGLRAIAS
ncbi:MAG: hypothetical protein GEU79_09745 [Acidimicrobiia bacterium]|nr:hypothetical protein [Acidimicrobiia bacterium]